MENERDNPASQPHGNAGRDATPEPDRIAKAKAYLGALAHIRLVPIYIKTSATDVAGMGHLSASRQSVDNLLLLGFNGTIEVIYVNNGYNEDTFRDLFPAFPAGGRITGPTGTTARIEYIPQEPADGKPGLRKLPPAGDGQRLHEKNRGVFPRRHVQLINNWDLVASVVAETDSVAEAFTYVRQYIEGNPKSMDDLDPGDARYIVGLLAFGWTNGFRQFVYDSKKNMGYHLNLPNKHLVSYLRPHYPDPIADALQLGRERVPGAVLAFMAQHPILKDNSPLQVLVSGFSGGTLTINCRRGTTVAQLKQLVRDKTAIPANLQSLQFRGRVLVDGKVLDEYGAMDGDVIRGNVRGGHVPGDPGNADASAVTAAPPGKLVDVNTTRTIAAILEGTALGTWDLLPGYGFHITGAESLDRVARSIRKAQVVLGRRRPIVFISMRHSWVPSDALLKKPGVRYFKAGDPDAATDLMALQPEQLAIVVAGGIPGPLFNQLILSATLPIVLEGAGTASFAIQQGIPYIALADNGSIVEDSADMKGHKRLKEVGKWLSSSAQVEKEQEKSMIGKLAAVMVEAVQAGSEMAAYFRTLSAAVHQPEQQQMAAAFEQLYDLTKRKVTVRRTFDQPERTSQGATIFFTIVFSKAPATFTAEHVTLSGTGTVNLAATRKTITPLPTPPEDKRGKVAVAYGLSVQGITGTGLLAASIAAGAVQAVGGASFPASTSANLENTVTLG